MARKYGKKAQRKIGRVMEEYKRGSLKTHGRRVKSRKQAVAIGISEARQEGDKVPAKRRSASKKTSKKASRKTAGAKRTASKKTARKTRAAGRKSAPKKSTRRKRTVKKS
ncbi:MAG TPA: DUF6496 domain-containing protein [Candidatus Paceibacterota bacterium]|nr:DUF6496 domain-containing protein [Candidatus Paceibacterota bacterium]